MRRIPLVCLAAVCAPVFALPSACPSNLTSLVAVGTGSCTVSGLGTLSNFRFSVSSTNGGASWNTAASSLGLTPGFATAVFSLQPGGVGSATSTSTYNLAFNLAPPSGNTITGASFSFSFSFGAGAVPTLGGTESLCLNGVFASFPPIGCSGAIQNLTVPTFNPSTQLPQNPAAINFSATSADVLVTGTGSGDLLTLGGSQAFTITPIATPTPTPAPPSILLAVAGLGTLGLYLTWQRSSRA